MNKLKIISILLSLLIFLNTTIILTTKGCKDIVACGDATGGDYNLLLKVRDPSRIGLQILSIIPKNYEYTYHHPWTGETMKFKTIHKYIGVASKGDTIPNIIKAGMTLSDSGLSFGDADTNSFWVNHRKFAWDDFDWIRYSCEKADNEDQAVNYLTKDLVDEMHATGVSENLFVVGPNTGFVIEADAYRYDIKEIKNGVAAMSNYPKNLWKTHIIKRLQISKSFDTIIEKNVYNKGIIRLRSLYGIKIVEIGNDFIKVKPVPLIYAIKTKNLGVITKIQLGERKTVGDFSVTLLDIDGRKAKVSVCNIYKAWEDKILEYIHKRYGSITVKDMINWSRLHKEDLDGLRPMCQKVFDYESAAIYKIPKKNYEIMSIGWFSPNHACSSIYVPFHICNSDIYDSYESGEAAQLSLDLLDIYGSDNLSYYFSKTEDVFLNEIEELEIISNDLLRKNTDISEFLTIIDTGMQKQAFFTEEIWMDLSRISNNEDMINIIADMWDKNYSNSLINMRNVLTHLYDNNRLSEIENKIVVIVLDICESRIEAIKSIGHNISYIENEYHKGSKLMNKRDYEKGFDYIQKSFHECNILINGKNNEINKLEIFDNSEINPFIYMFFVLLILLIIFVFIKMKRN